MVSNNLHNEKKKLKSGKKRKRQAMVEKTKPGDPSSTDSDDNSPKKAKSDEGINSAAHFLKETSSDPRTVWFKCHLYQKFVFIFVPLSFYRKCFVF